MNRLHRGRPALGAWCALVLTACAGPVAPAATPPPAAPVTAAPTPRPALATATPAPPPAATMAAAMSPVASPTGPGAAGFADRAAFDAQLAGAVAAGTVDAFWARVRTAGRMPLVFGDTAVFLYRGPAHTVEWVGDFTQWGRDPATAGTRQGASDVWVWRHVFEPDARLDYKILVDGTTWLLDPLNPFTQQGGFGPNSTLRMPAYVYPAVTLPRADGPHGTLAVTATLQSRALGRAVAYRVYTPPGYPGRDPLPVLYATDGQEYSDPAMGALPVTLDNLIAAGQIRPILAVFVDARDPATGANLRDRDLPPQPSACPFCAMLAGELVPRIDAAYRTDPRPAARAIVGTSLGGLNAAYMGRAYPDVFGLIGIQSPYLAHHRWVRDAYAAGPRTPIRVFLAEGTYDLDVPGTRALRDVLAAQGYPLTFVETHDGHSWGNWRGILPALLTTFFGPAAPPGS